MVLSPEEALERARNNDNNLIKKLEEKVDDFLINNYNGGKISFSLRKISSYLYDKYEYNCLIIVDPLFKKYIKKGWAVDISVGSSSGFDYLITLEKREKIRKSKNSKVI